MALWVRHNGGVQTANGPVAFSNYLVTVNANLPANAHARGRTAITHCMSHVLRPQIIWQWLTAEQADGTYRSLNTVAERNMVRAVRARIAVEANGAQNASPHLHCYLEITHRLRVRIDYAQMNAAIRIGLQNNHLTQQEALGANIDIRLVRGGSNEYLLHYLTKNRNNPNHLPAPVGDNQPTDTFVAAMNNNPANQAEPVYIAHPSLGDAVGRAPGEFFMDEQQGHLPRQSLN